MFRESATTPITVKMRPSILTWPPDRVPASPQRLGLDFGEHHVAQIAVTFFEEAAGYQPLPRGLEISGAHPAKVDQGRFQVGFVHALRRLDPRFAGERHGAHHGRGLNAGNGAQVDEDRVIETDAALVLAVTLRGEPDLGHCHLAGIEAFLLTEQTEQALGKQAGDEQQRGAACNLQTDQPSAQMVALAASDRAAARLLERGLGIGRSASAP